jgi:hypothetical protein
VQGRRYPHMGLWEPMRFKVSKWVETWIIGWLLMPVAVAYAVAAAFFGPEHVLLDAGDFIASIWTRLA